MAFRSISVGLALGVVGWAVAAPVGRYGWSSRPAVPGWVLQDDGVKPSFARSDKLNFLGTISKWAPVGNSGTAYSATLISSGKAPTKVRASVFGWGAEFYFERGFEMRVTSLKPPLLTWLEGSVDQDVPTAPAPWVAMSFQDSQPPVIFGFCGKKVGLMVSGKPGNWILKADGAPYKGWVRFGLPLGARALTTTDAASLGVLVKEMAQHDEFWSLPQLPKLKAVEVLDEPGVIRSIWRFDSPCALVPEAALLSARGGYGITMSEIVRIEAPMVTGPVAYSRGAELEFRFPAYRIPAGRALTSGQVTRAPLPKERYAAVFVRAMRSLFANGSPEDWQGLEAARADFLERADLVKEPITSQRLPIKQDGAGLLNLAAAALAESVLQRSKTPNPLLSTLSWTLDWGTWTWSAPDEDERRRAAALIAVAGAVREKPLDRLLGAMAHAGLCAERGRWVYKGSKNAPLHLEPVDGFRASLYPAQSDQPPASTLLAALQSPVRMLSGPQMRALNRDNAYDLSWTARNQGLAALRFSPPLVGEPVLTHNLKVAALDPLTGTWSAKALQPGPVTLTVKMPPEFFVKLAKSANPVYAETKR